MPLEVQVLRATEVTLAVTVVLGAQVQQAHQELRALTVETAARDHQEQTVGREILEQQALQAEQALLERRVSRAALEVPGELVLPEKRAERERQGRRALAVVTARLALRDAPALLVQLDHLAHPEIPVLLA